jgi:uncharacterized cupin superfamily protein
MADEVHDVVKGDGYALAHLDGIGEGPGFRKVRRALGVTGFGVNAIVIPPGITGTRHKHERQEELYFVHRGRLELRFGDGSSHILGPGGVAWMDAQTVREVHNPSVDEDVVFLAVGAAGGYVGRDGQPPDD